MFQQSVWLQMIIVYHISDQLIINTFLQVNPSELDPLMSFKLWWFWHFAAFCLIHVLFPAAFLFTAYKEYPEFWGLQARRYPGQELPEQQLVQPRRLQGPEPLLKVHCQPDLSVKKFAVMKDSNQQDLWKELREERKQENRESLIYVKPKETSHTFFDSHKKFNRPIILNIDDLINKELQHQSGEEKSALEKSQHKYRKNGRKSKK